MLFDLASQHSLLLVHRSGFTKSTKPAAGQVFVSFCDPTGWLSELWAQHPYILASIDILKTTLAANEQPTNVIEFPVRRHRDTDDDMPKQLAA